jgi:sensor histidine kinase YesM
MIFNAMLLSTKTVRMATFITLTERERSAIVTLESMQRYPFIFSDETRYRFRRHFLFWSTWWLFQSFLYSFSAPIFHISYLRRLPVSTMEALVYLLPHIFLAYSLMYWVIPKILLKGKYVMTVTSVVLLFLATALISSIIGVYLLPPLRLLIFGKVFERISFAHDIFLFSALLAGLRGAITVGGLAAAIKLMKYWYMKEQRNLQLQKENVDAQLQILKAQVHPHFLFNTLNNIYSYTQNTSAVASRLVMGLSDMLRYMLYECNQPLVPLSKELKMLQDYIVLEQIRYNQQLDVNVVLPTAVEDIYIAPLLLLPFVENCFKHGTSQVLEHPWVSLHIAIENDQMKMKLVNGKAENYVPKKAPGIGISNVQKRLDLLYAGKYFLKINNERDVFVVTLRIDLERIKGRESKPIQLMQHA